MLRNTHSPNASLLKRIFFPARSILHKKHKRKGIAAKLSNCSPMQSLSQSLSLLYMFPTQLLYLFRPPVCAAAASSLCPNACKYLLITRFHAAFSCPLLSLCIIYWVIYSPLSGHYCIELYYVSSVPWFICTTSSCPETLFFDGLTSLAFKSRWVRKHAFALNHWYMHSKSVCFFFLHKTSGAISLPLFCVYLCLQYHYCI